ncbi:MAG: hypothetical protein JW913_05520 [Chitinispirillaceae bacterium]|nr:hypothetical protein [Chitinispirillaceae bacterium]
MKITFNLDDAKKKFVDRMNKIKGKYEYDALVGVSGGKDSTFVLHQLVNVYGLKVLAVTYDNGFLTEFAYRNIENLVKKIKVDHYFHTPRLKAQKEFYKAATLKIVNPCTACATGGYFLALKICHERKIPFFIHGRTPYQMFSTMYEGTDDPFLFIMEMNLQEHSFRKIAGVYKPIHEHVRNYIKNLFNNDQEANAVLNEFFLEGSEFNSAFAPESLAYFLSHAYNEQKIKRELSDAIGWIETKNDTLLSHHDCAIHDAVFYLFQQLGDADLLEPEIAAILRMGDINRADGKKMLENARRKREKPYESIKSLCQVCGIKEDEIEEAVNSNRLNLSK